jgi:uncharacterized protein (TIGR03086 family)
MDLVELHATAEGECNARVHAIRDDQWTNPTPCTEWDVRTLLNHLVYEQLWAPELLRGATVEEIGDRFDGDVLGDDPFKSWSTAARAAHDEVAKVDMNRMIHVSWGQIPASEYVDQLILDLAVHGWDVAKGIGYDDTIDPGVVDAVLSEVERDAEMLRASGVFGTPVPVAADADPQTRLLALLGRRR